MEKCYLAYTLTRLRHRKMKRYSHGRETAPIHNHTENVVFVPLQLHARFTPVMLYMPPERARIRDHVYSYVCVLNTLNVTYVKGIQHKHNGLHYNKRARASVIKTSCALNSYVCAQV